MILPGFEGESHPANPPSTSVYGSLHPLRSGLCPRLHAVPEHDQRWWRGVRVVPCLAACPPRTGGPRAIANHKARGLVYITSQMTTPGYLLLSVILISFLCGAGCVHGREGPVPDHEVMARLLGNATGAIQDSLDRLDETAGWTAASLGKTGIAGPEAEALLRQGVASHPAIRTMITCNADGIVVAAEPDDAKSLVGQNLGGQEAVQRALAEKVPVMSGMFPLAEGGKGVVIERPVRSDGGDFLGVLSTMFIPYDLIRPIAEDAANGTSFSFMAIETGGHILYDPDPGEVGKETFGDALYSRFPEIDRVARHAAANRSGYDTYSFYSTGFGEVVRKETYWSTAGLHGTEWRVMVIGEIEGIRIPGNLPFHFTTLLPAGTDFCTP